MENNKQTEQLKEKEFQVEVCIKYSEIIQDTIIVYAKTKEEAEKKAREKANQIIEKGEYMPGDEGDYEIRSVYFLNDA